MEDTRNDVRSCEKYGKATMRAMTHNVWNGTPGGRDVRYPGFYRKYAPDILCLQEMSPRICTNTLIQGLKQDYDFVPVDTDGQPNYTPVLVKKGMFRILECGWHVFSGFNDCGSKTVTWAALERIDGGERFGVASNHFWWQERDETDEACRIGNVREMYAFIHYLHVKYDMPVLTMGDLNCHMRSRPYAEILRGGAVDAIGCAQISANRSNTCHDYPVPDENGIYGNGPKQEGTCLEAIDHIFVYDLSRLDVYVHEVVTEQAALDLSDHCPVYVDFSVRKRDSDHPRVWNP